MQAVLKGWTNERSMSQSVGSIVSCFNNQAYYFDL